MKTTTKIITFIIAFCIFSLSGSAHPGRTDSNGGHYDRSTGEYHYHDGRYAGREQSGSASTKEEKPFTPPRESVPKAEDNTIKIIKEEPEEAREENTSSTWLYTILILIGVVLFGSLCSLIYGYIQDHTTKIIKKYDECLKRTVSNISKGVDLKKKLSDIPASVFPEGVEIGKDGLPKEADAKGWGKAFTGYRTAYGYKIHYKKGCCGSYKKEHLYYHRDSRCLICYKNVPLPDFSWYDSYKKADSIKNEIIINSGYLESHKKELVKIHTQCNCSKNKSFMSKRQKITVEDLNCQYDMVFELL